MEQGTTFTYKYSAAENKAVQDIRKKYLPQEENKLEELKHLDNTVQNSGIMSSLIVGITGTLLFGTAVCMITEIIGGGLVLGILLAIPSVTALLAAYPVYRKVAEKTKEKYTPRILVLIDELSEKHY